MIVKNEEACLGRCLQSVYKYVDEIIIVDTGSTDRTIEIAECYGARIHYHPWENDFSKHRNQSLSYATGDWILQLDADEELFAEDGQKIQTTAGQGSADYYYYRFHDIRKDGSVHGVFSLIRFFRNGMGMHFTQKVHNQLQARGSGAFSSIRIRHYGYDLSEEKMEAKHTRTTTLLKEMLEENPEDAYSRHQLAASYSMHRDYAKAIEQGEMALDTMRRKGLRNEFFMTTFYTVAQGYYALANTAAAERIGLEALEVFPIHLDICHLLAAIYFKRRSLDQCRAMSQRYLDIHETLTTNSTFFESFYCQSLTKRHEIFFGLGCIHFFQKDFEKADGFFRQSFDDSGRQIEKAEHICRFYLEQQLDQPALQWLNRAFDADHTSTAPLPDAPHSKTDTGALAYEVAETLCLRRQWHLAEKALTIAVQVAPAGFDHNKFDRLLRVAELQTAQPS